MAVPKGKVSKQRRNKRRSSVWKLAAPGLVACAARCICLTECARSAVPITAARSSTLSLWQQASKIPCVLVRREDFHLPSLLFAQFSNKMVVYR